MGKRLRKSSKDKQGDFPVQQDQEVPIGNHKREPGTRLAPEGDFTYGPGVAAPATPLPISGSGGVYAPLHAQHDKGQTKSKRKKTVKATKHPLTTIWETQPQLTFTEGGGFVVAFEQESKNQETGSEEYNLPEPQVEEVGTKHPDPIDLSPVKFGSPAYQRLMERWFVSDRKTKKAIKAVLDRAADEHTLVPVKAEQTPPQMKTDEPGPNVPASEAIQSETKKSNKSDLWRKATLVSNARTTFSAKCGVLWRKLASCLFQNCSSRKIFSKWMESRTSYTYPKEDFPSRKLTWQTKPQPGEGNSNPHRRSAHVRSEACDTIAKYASENGYKVHSLCPSYREQRRGFEGESMHHTAADLGRPYADDDLQNSDLIALTDTLDHLPLSEIGRYASHPIAIFTATPPNLAGSDDEKTWYYTDKDTVVTEYKQGIKYTDIPWNLDSDQVIIEHYITGFNTPCGTALDCTCFSGRYEDKESYNAFTLYQIAKLPCPSDPTKAIYILTPKTTIWESLKDVRRQCEEYTGHPYDSPTIEDVNSTILELEGWLVTRFTKDAVPWVSLKAKESQSDSSVELRLSTFEAMYHIYSTASVFTSSDVNRHIKVLEYEGIKENVDENQMVSLCTYFNTVRMPTNFLNLTIFGSYDGMSYEVPTKGLATQATPPLVESKKAYAEDSNSAIDAINRRLLEKKNDNKEPSEEIMGYRKEFVELFTQSLRDKKHYQCVKTLTIAEVDQQQNKPLQKARDKRTRHQQVDYNSQPTLQSFGKKEGCVINEEKRSSQRLIHMVQTPEQKDFATVALPASKALTAPWLKSRSWSAQNKNPTQTANLVTDQARDLLRNHGGISPTDYSKMDASTSSFAQELCRDLLLLTLDPKFHERFNNGFNCTMNAVARHKNVNKKLKARKYKTGSMNTSGNVVTGARNECLAAFVVYVANRRRGMIPLDAWMSIGPKYSDDGISPPTDSISVAAELGYTLTYEGKHDVITEKIIAEGDGPVPFLGRFWPDVRTSNSSYADPLRVMQSVPPIWVADVNQGLANRIFGYLVTEAQTPIISDYLQALVRVHKLQPPSEKQLKEDTSVGWRVKRGPYPWDLSMNQIASQQIAEMIGLAPRQIGEFVAKCKSAETIEDLRNLVISRCSFYKDEFNIHRLPDRVPQEAPASRPKKARPIFGQTS